MKLFRKKQIEERGTTLESLVAVLGGIVNTDTITVDKALNIPTLASCVELITNTVACVPWKLYKENETNIEVVKDGRTNLLNDETGDTLDGFQFKKALVRDFLLEGAGYAYINRQRNKVKSIHYLENNKLSVMKNTDPIFKDYDIVVDAKNYKPFEFIKLTRNTKDGITGTSIIQENQKILSVAYNTLVFEDMLVKGGGNKKGFLKSENKLEQTALDALKDAWNKLYKNNTENVVILNKGVEFTEASSTSVEMQLNENKRSNSNEICNLVNVPSSFIDNSRSITQEDVMAFVKNCIMPILTAMARAFNKELLLESEKRNMFFAPDTKELMKGDILKRFQAHEIAIRNGIETVDEVRYYEDMENLDLKFLKLGLESVLYNVDTKDIFVTNTGQTYNMDKPPEQQVNNVDKAVNKELKT